MGDPTDNTDDAPLIEAMARAAEEVERLRLEKITGGKVARSYDWEAYIPAMTAALAAYRRAQWQPIETAPKDGTTVLVFAQLNPPEKWVEEVRDLPPMICQAAHHPDAGWCVCTMREVTHWQPLPQPPKTTP